SNQKTKSEEPPLVPGFGLDSEPTPVAGFGVRVRPSGRVILGIEGDVEPRIRDLFGRLDRNGNGLLDRNEWTGLPGNPSQFDANQDGRITLAEVAAQMDKIQKDRNQNPWGGMGQGGFGPGGGMPGNFGPGGFGAGGWGGMNGFGDNRQDDEDKEESTSKTAKADHRSSYRFRSALERLPKGLPDWFVGRDEDFDGQVSMAEFAGTWTQSTLNEYLKYDGNRDGVITPDECLRPGSGGGATSTSAPRPRQSRSSRSSSGSGSSNSWWLPN
ncbi:MAG: hypothetical protein JW719_04475, partial [Pirellulales bacterium]|nr:hypothetical protein [Pirellulales bacterium]